MTADFRKVCRLDTEQGIKGIAALDFKSQDQGGGWHQYGYIKPIHRPSGGKGTGSHVLLWMKATLCLLPGTPVDSVNSPQHQPTAPKSLLSTNRGISHLLPSKAPNADLPPVFSPESGSKEVTCPRSPAVMGSSIKP